MMMELEVCIRERTEGRTFSKCQALFVIYPLKFSHVYIKQNYYYLLACCQVCMEHNELSLETV